MNICGIALGCLILALGALLAYIGMAALMEMWLGADSTSLNVLCGVKYPSDFDRHSFLGKKYLNSAEKKWWACWGVQRQAVAPTLLYSRIVLDPEQAGFWGFSMLQWMQWMQWVLSEALIWCFHPHYAGPTLDAMLFVYGNGACVRDFTCLGSVFFLISPSIQYTSSDLRSDIWFSLETLSLPSSPCCFQKRNGQKKHREAWQFDSGNFEINRWQMWNVKEKRDVSRPK